MINKEMREFPIIYSAMGRYAIGWGAHTTVANECKNAGIKKALIVTTGLRGTGIIDEIKGILEYGGISVTIFDKVTSNPKDHEVMAAYKVFKEAQCDGVVSIGGGSSHDCGKAVRAVATNNGRHVSEFYMGAWTRDTSQDKPITIPQIAINTTAGTGAETSGAGFVTDTKNRAKRGVKMAGITPAIGITDPLLVRLMPQNIAAWTGFDALAHGFEAILGRIWVPPTVFLQMGVVKLVAENLREFAYNRMNYQACEAMCWASSMGGLALAFGGGPGGRFSVHGYGHHVGAVTDGHHGFINGALTIPIERRNQNLFPEKFAEMARQMGVDTRGMTKMQAADKWFDEIERLLADLNIKSGQLNEQIGLKLEDLDHIIDTVLSDFMVHIEKKEEKAYRAEAHHLLESML